MPDYKTVFRPSSNPSRKNFPKLIFSLLILLFSLVSFGCDNGTTTVYVPTTADPSIAGGTGMPSTDWYTADPDAANFTINNADDLAGLAYLVNKVGMNYSFRIVL